MGFYVRKSFRVGLTRINLSKSGMGISVGIRGLRFGINSSGTYVHAGGNGIYYRKSFKYKHNNCSNITKTPLPKNSNKYNDALSFTIGSAPANEIIDSNVDEFIQSIRQCKKRLPITPVWIILLFFLFFNQMFNEIEIIAKIIVSVIGLIIFSAIDEQRRNVVLVYDLEGVVKENANLLFDGFQALASCDNIWSVVNQQSTNDYKRNAGASSLITRTQAKLSFEKIPFVKTNIPIPSIKLHTDTIHFFPDIIVVQNRGGIGALRYSELEAFSRHCNFREAGSLPADATCVGETWRFVNKSGGPDRRFNNNRRIPIMNYQELLFSSTTGLQAHLQISSANGANSFLNSLERLKHSLNQPSISPNFHP